MVREDKKIATDSPVPVGGGMGDGTGNRHKNKPWNGG